VLAIIGHSKKNSAQLGRVGNFKAAPVDAANEQQHSDIVNIQYPEIDSIDAEQQHSDIINIYPEINPTDAAANRQQHSDPVIIWPEQRADEIKATAVSGLLDLGEIFLRAVLLFTQEGYAC